MKTNYGWTVVGAGFVITCVGIGAMMSLSVFLPAISQAMGWSRTGIATAALLNFLCMGVGSFMWGALSDRFGTRLVVIAGGILLGAGFVTASRAETLGQFQLLFGVLVGVATGAFYAPLTSAVTRWFTTNRTLAVALVSAGMSVGAMLVGPLARSIITAYDWRTAMMVIGDLAWLLIVPAALLVRVPPANADDATPAATARGGRELTVGQALRTPQFAAIAFTHFACCAAHSGPIFHMVANAIDHGITAMAATTVFSAAGFASLTGRIVCGLVADRVGVKRVLVAGLTLQAMAVALYLATAQLGAFYALALMFGFSYGGVMPLYGVLVREYFGAKIMGSIFGAVAFTSTIGMALGPLVGGWVFDAFGNYFWLFIGSAGIGLGAVAIAFTFRPPQPAVVALRPSVAG